MITKQIARLYKKCKESDSIFVIVVLRVILYKIAFNKSIFCHQNVKIRGIKNIAMIKPVEVGLRNIRGKLKFKGKYSIGRGCRFDVGENAKVTIGKSGFINANSKLIIMHGLEIGDNCVVSWDCQFLDEDFHEIRYKDKKETKNEITIGNKVWIGCGAKIYKGSSIPDGCVIGADSVVRSEFAEKNTLIAGNPARVVRHNIEWE